MKLPNKVAIIGAGSSGLFMAQRLEELADKQGKEVQVTLFEKQNHVGGKCHTYRDKNDPELRSEYGAGALAINYGVVIDLMKKYGVDFEYMLDSKDSIELESLAGNMSFIDKSKFVAQLIKELNQFDGEYLKYKKAKESMSLLPEGFELPFSEFCKSKNWQHLESLLKPLVPGFGYGDLSMCPAYCILEYMGRTTLSSMLINDKILNRPALLAVHGGFQTLMEQMAQSFDVRCNTTIESIKREPDNVSISYFQDDVLHQEDYDCMVLATSPLNWQSLGMELTKVESECVEQLSYYRYPIAICKIKGLENKQYFFPKALEREGFGHVALITTRDNRVSPEEGRLCTIYVNQLPGENDFDFVKKWKSIEDDLKSIDNVTQATLIEAKYWQDYMPTLPWELRLQLEKQQFSQDTNTIYLGAYTLGAFEDVLSTANKANNTADQLFGRKFTPVENFSWKETSRATMFYGKAYPAYTDDGFSSKEMRGCTIL
jgi:Flavin containing amine oxidoreductase